MIMPSPDTAALAARIIAAVEQLIPEYLADPADRNIANGNLAICIIDEAGQIYGRMFGPDQNRKRQSFRVAWTKASQVWITGMKTGEYEKAVYGGQVDESRYGISRPDLIGWEGGQPFTLPDGTRLSVGVSGLRGVSDLAIAVRALKNLRLVP
jgi:glc operon protein GlcG